MQHQNVGGGLNLSHGMSNELDLDQYLEAFLSNMNPADGGRLPNLGFSGGAGGGGSMNGGGQFNPNTISTPSFPMQHQQQQQQQMGGGNHPLGYPSTLGYIPGSNPLQFGLFNSQSAPLNFQSQPNNLPQAQQSAHLQAQAAQFVAQQQQMQRQGGGGGGGGGGTGGWSGMGGNGGLGLGQQQQQQQQQAPAKNAKKGKAAAGGGRRKSEATAGGDSSGEMDDSSGGGSGSGSDGDGGGGGGKGGSRKKRDLGPDEAERRHNALQEKNRRAQRRFRERQKSKLSDLHKQIEDLTGKVGTLQTENSALHSRTSILEKVLDMRNEQIQVMQETKEQNYGYAGSEDEASALQGVGGHLVQLTPEIVKELSSDQIYKIYQTYMKELSVLLAKVDPASGDEAQQEGLAEMEQLVKDLSMMIMRLGVIKPLETRKFIVISRQYLGNTETEVIELWKNVMRSIDLADPQKREVVELKRQFLHKIEPIMEERKHLNVQIQSNLPHDTFHTKNALTYIKAHEAVIKLRDNLRAEQHVVLEFAIAVFRGVFKPRQMGQLLVKCYPAVPDALGIASALSVELGEPESAQARQIAMQLGGYTLQQGGASNSNSMPQQGQGGSGSGGGGMMGQGGQGGSGSGRAGGMAGQHGGHNGGGGGGGGGGMMGGGMMGGGTSASLLGHVHGNAGYTPGVAGSGSSAPLPLPLNSHLYPGGMLPLGLNGGGSSGGGGGGQFAPSPSMLGGGGGGGNGGGGGMPHSGLINVGHGGGGGDVLSGLSNWRQAGVPGSGGSGSGGQPLTGGML